MTMRLLMLAVLLGFARQEAWAIVATGGTISTVTVNGVQCRVHQFEASGAITNFVVTQGGGPVTVVMWGGGGGGTLGVGGAGGYSKGTISLAAGQELKVLVGKGGQGERVSALGGWPNGGNAGNTRAGCYGAGGGGRSAVTTSNGVDLIVAGGGGAAGAHDVSSTCGGAGGGANGQDAPASAWYSTAGKGGTQTAGGSGGSAGGLAGSSHQGGNGDAWNGTGGGDGYYGGGAGDDHQGGGGGSGYIGGSGVCNATTTAGAYQVPAGTTDSLYRASAGCGGCSLLDGSNGLVIVRYACEQVAISGQIKNAMTGAGVAGATVMFSNDGGSTTSSSNGSYTQVVAKGWSGTITPSCSDGTFAPASITVPTVSQATTVANILWTPSPWLNYDYAKRVQVEIRNQHIAFLTNYQVELNIPYLEGMRPDMADIQMGDFQGNPLPFWTERVVTNTNAVVWVKVPYVAALGTTNIYLYYGNSSVTNRGNGDAVFLFFDDFEDGEVNTNKWPLRNLGTYITESNGTLKVTNVKGTNYYLQSGTFPVSTIPFALECRTRTLSAPYNGWSPLQWMNVAGGSELNMLEHGQNSGQYIGVNNDYPWKILNVPLAEYHRNSIMVLATNRYRFTSQYDASTSYNLDSWSAGYSNCAAMSGTYRIRMAARGDGWTGGDQGMNGEVDAIWMRTGCPIAPSSAILSNTMLTLTNAFRLYPVSGRVRSSFTGDGVGGVRIGYTKRIDIFTTPSGHYTQWVAAAWSGTITPSPQDGTFAPASITVPAVSQATTVADILWTPSSWMNYGYAKRVQVEIRNQHTAFLTNYQVELNIPYLEGMRPDMADIQMGDFQGNPLPFWTERVVTNTNAVVWVKVPYVAALGTTNIYLYYGNSSVTNRGNGDAVFLFFDDFEDGEVNTNKWPLRNLGTYITESNGTLKVTNVKGTNYYLQSGTFPVSTIPFALECRTRSLSAPYHGWSPLQWMSTAGGSELNMLEHGNNSGQYIGVDYGYPWMIPYVPLAEYHRNSIMVLATNRYRFTSQYDASTSNNLDSWSAGYSNCAAMSGTYRIRMGARGDGEYATDQSMDGDVEAIWMRTGCPIAPSSAILSNTMRTLTNAFRLYPVSGRVRNSFSGDGMGGARIGYTKGVDIFTTPSGYYTQWMGAAWSGTVTPSYVVGRFAPTSLVVSAISQAMTLADLYWTPPPSATNLSPAVGIFSGGTTVLITGTNFSSSPLPVVWFGARAGTGLTRINSTTLRVATPTNLPGQTVDVQVTNGDGQSCVLTNAFTYRHAAPVLQSVVPDRGNVEGGYQLILTGQNFIGDLNVWVGTNQAVVGGSTNSSTIQVVCPPGTCGVASVTVRCGDGQTTTLANAFTYMPEIRGVVTNDLTGAGMTNVAVASWAGNYSATTGVGGAYALLVPLGWTGQVSATTALPGLLAPTSRPYANVRTILTNQNYAFSPANPMISGYVSNGVTGVMLDGVTVNFSASGGQTITTNGGYYSRTLPYGWTGTVTLAYTTAQGAHTFVPASCGYTNLILAFTNQNYGCSPPYYPGTRYVSLSGLNQYPYTNWESSAWSLQAAINSCRGGETIMVGDGVYDVDGMITVDRAVTIRSVNGPTTTIVQRVSGNGGLVNVVATNAVVDGLTIRGGYLSAYFVYYRSVVYGIGSAAGVALYNNSTLQNCIVRDCVAAGMDVPAGVRLESGAKAINCLIYNNSSGPFDYNMNSLVGGVWMGTNSYLVNSVVYGNKGYGIYRRSEYYTEGAGGVFKAPGGNAYMDNCLIWNNTGGDLRGMPSGSLVARNSTYSSADKAVSPDAYCMRGDPGFVDAAAGNFRLQPWSLAINSGQDGYTSLTNDILMKPRKVFGIDRGAYECTGVLYRVSGRITNEYYAGRGLENALLDCSGGVTATSEPNGYYVALLNPNWTGTVTPSYSNGFFLAPESIAVGAGLTNELRNQNFSWRPPHPFLNGRITHGITGVGLDGVSVYFSNGAGTTLTTNGGWYSQMVTGRWSGAVTSYFAAGGSFTPASRSLSSVLTNQFDLDYVWTPPVQTISGRVTNYFTGAAVTGVLVQFSSGGGVCTSGVNGVYTGRLYHGWSGRATPSHPWGGAFQPVEYREYELLSANVTNQDYAWVPADPVISGLVTNSFNGLGAEGVVLTFSGGQGVVTTAQDGAFTMTMPYGWSGTVTPSHVVGTFTSPWRSYTNLTTNALNQTFRWTPDLRAISGRIIHGDTGVGMTNVTVYFSNGGGSAVTTNGGYYTRSLYYTWHGTASPSGGVRAIVAPASRSYESITSAIPDQDYVWYPHRTISGQVTHQETGMGVDGMSILCSGTNDLVTANGGYFSTVVPHGWSGVLRPQPTDGHCVATQRTYSAVSADMAEQSFAWYPPRTISGRVTNRVSGVGVDGVQILLGGVPAGTTFNGGYYFVSTNQGWSGTVAPALAGWVFLPASASVANLATDQVLAFGGTAESVLVTGRVVNVYTTQGVAGVTLTFSNGGGSALTDKNGSYIRQVPFNWSGTATVSIPAGGAFDPAQRTYASLQATAAGQDYVWTPPALTVSGTLTDGENGVPLAFVVVTNSTGGFVSSQADGRYEMTVYHGWSGTLTPAKALGFFQPLSRSYAGLVSNLTDQSFVWRSNRVVSGQVTNGVTGTNLAGVVVTLSDGLGGMVTTNDGLYSLPVPYGWSGTLTATFTNWLSVPSGYAFSNVVENQSGKNLGLYPPG